MNELRIIRGKDTVLFADNRELCGVTDFFAVKKPRFHRVYEYLSSSEYEAVPCTPEYEIKLCLLSLFDGQLPDEKFTLKAVGLDTEYIYGGCTVTKAEVKIDGNKIAKTVFTIQAESLTEQEAEDDE